jgi:single-strand DNA-binding protein
MNKLTIIGNLTRDPELRVTPSGVNVCDFSVAVNRKQSAQQRANGQQQEADFFRVTAWRELGENCSKYLAKGRKVAVIGPVSVRTYTGNDGITRASLEVTADEVEFLTPRGDATAPAPAAQGAPAPAQAQTYQAPAAPQAAPYPAAAPAAYQAPAQQAYPQGFTAVETDELPF